MFVMVVMFRYTQLNEQVLHESWQTWIGKKMQLMEFCKSRILKFCEVSGKQVSSDKQVTSINRCILWNIIVGFVVIKTMNSYRTRDYETAEKHPDGIESRGDNGSYVDIRSQSYCHHSVVCVVQKCEEHEEEKPEELVCLPLEVDHRVHDHSIHRRLNKYIWHFDQYLHNIIDTLGTRRIQKAFRH